MREWILLSSRNYESTNEYRVISRSLTDSTYYTISEAKRHFRVRINDFPSGSPMRSAKVVDLKKSDLGDLIPEHTMSLSEEEIDGLESVLPELADIWGLLRRMDSKTELPERFFVVSPCMVDDSDKDQLLKELEEMKSKIAVIEQRLEEI